MSVAYMGKIKGQLTPLVSSEGRQDGIGRTEKRCDFPSGGTLSTQHTPWRLQLGMCEKLPARYNCENLLSLIRFARLPPSSLLCLDLQERVQVWLPAGQPYVCTWEQKGTSSRG